MNKPKIIGLTKYNVPFGRGEHRHRQQVSRPFGRQGARNGLPVIQQLTDPKFMTSSQKKAFAEGVEIWV